MLSLISQKHAFHLLKYFTIFNIIIFFMLIFIHCLTDSSIAFCMEQECVHVLNNDGIVQLHPKTGDPLTNCKTTKSEFALAMETIKDLVDRVKPTDPKITNDASNCKTCH